MVRSPVRRKAVCYFFETFLAQVTNMKSIFPTECWQVELLEMKPVTRLILELLRSSSFLIRLGRNLLDPLLQTTVRFSKILPFSDAKQQVQQNE
jgi:hypothetical protein